MSTITAQIQLRRDTVANWTSNNPILLAGEIALSTDLLYTGTDQPRYKIGNGVDTWLNLDYVPEGGSGSFVPYTGATQDVDLDTFGLNAKFLSVKGNSGAGHLGLKHQSVNATAGGQETVLFAGSDGELYYKNDGGSVVQVASRTWVNSVNYNYYFFSSASINPADATAYHLSFNFEGMALTDSVRQFLFDGTETIKELYLTSIHSAAGSSEDVTLYIRNVTTATDYLVGNFKEDYTLSTSKTFKFTGLNIAVNGTDYWTIKVLTPTWVTNPTSVRYGIRLKTL